MEKSPIRSLHHVTATVDDARQDLDFYRDLLGLRLVKRTVNFDNHHVFHFYYGDERGTPGTIWTTFPYKGHGVPVGRIGVGQIAVTSSRFPAIPWIIGASGWAREAYPWASPLRHSVRSGSHFPIHPVSRWS